MAAQLVGWAGSILLIVSLKQKDPTRFRVMNLVASALLGVFALVVGALALVHRQCAVGGGQRPRAVDDATGGGGPCRSGGDVGREVLAGEG